MLPIITKEFSFEAGHRLPNHDGKCAHVHGHSWKLIVGIQGKIRDVDGASKQGMVIDFGTLKAVVKTNILDIYDHSFMMWRQDDELRKAFSSMRDKSRIYSLPFVPTSENLSAYFYDILKPKIETYGCKLAYISLSETESSCAYAYEGLENDD